MNSGAPPHHRRRSIRLSDYDYRLPGAYFITICTFERRLLFEDDRLRQIAEFNWAASFAIRAEIDPDVYVIMANHMHAIVWINAGDAPLAPAGAQRLSPPPGGAERLPRAGLTPRSLGSLIRGYKSGVTRDVNALLGTPGAPVWQRNYYEHIVRSERALDQISQYILDNPARWAYDRENPSGRPDVKERRFWSAVDRMGAQPLAVRAQGLAPSHPSIGPLIET